jgi:endonuclease YncB( thermonuclease family)
MVLIGNSANAAERAGIPRVVDGDTLAIGTAKIRLQGIDAPETDQVCLNAGGQQWTCGIEARDRLAAHIAGREITCVSIDIDVYGREVARCSVADEDLNGWMVREGWALAYVKYSSEYVTAEEQARTRQRGLWQGASIAPWDWRHRNNKTVILGAFSVPINAQSVLLPRSATEEAPSSGCTIKGNVNANGERIYHMPGQEFYGKVRMDFDFGKGKRWFCTKEEAEAAG